MLKRRRPTTLFGFTKAAFWAILHPNSNNQNMSVGETLGFYYKAAVIPLIAAVVVGIILYFTWHPAAIISPYSGIIPQLYKLLGNSYFVVYPIIYTLIFIPVGLLADAALYQLIAKMLFKIWKGTYNRTLAALMFGSLPAMLFAWLWTIPGIYLLLVIFAIWGLIVAIMSLSKQQNISGMRALGGILATIGIVIVVVIVITIIVVLVFAAFLASTHLVHPVLPASS